MSSNFCTSSMKEKLEQMKSQLKILHYKYHEPVGSETSTLKEDQHISDNNKRDLAETENLSDLGASAVANKKEECISHSDSEDDQNILYDKVSKFEIYLHF